VFCVPSGAGGDYATLVAATQLVGLVLRDAPHQLAGPDGRTAARELAQLATRLAAVNARIRDHAGDLLPRALAKDLLQRTTLALEYQLALHHPTSTLLHT
jgi:hypothetical protein